MMAEEWKDASEWDEFFNEIGLPGGGETYGDAWGVLRAAIGDPNYSQADAQRAREFVEGTSPFRNGSSIYVKDGDFVDRLGLDEWTYGSPAGVVAAINGSPYFTTEYVEQAREGLGLPEEMWNKEWMNSHYPTMEMAESQQQSVIDGTYHNGVPAPGFGLSSDKERVQYDIEEKESWMRRSPYNFPTSSQLFNEDELRFCTDEQLFGQIALAKFATQKQGEYLDVASDLTLMPLVESGQTPEDLQRQTFNKQVVRVSEESNDYPQFQLYDAMLTQQQGYSDYYDRTIAEGENRGYTKDMMDQYADEYIDKALDANFASLSMSSLEGKGHSVAAAKIRGMSITESPEETERLGKFGNGIGHFDMKDLHGSDFNMPSPADYVAEKSKDKSVEKDNKASVAVEVPSVDGIGGQKFDPDERKPLPTSEHDAPVVTEPVAENQSGRKERTLPDISNIKFSKTRSFGMEF